MRLISRDHVFNVYISSFSTVAFKEFQCLLNQISDIFTLLMAEVYSITWINWLIKQNKTNKYYIKFTVMLWINDIGNCNWWSITVPLSDALLCDMKQSWIWKQGGFDISLRFCSSSDLVWLYNLFVYTVLEWLIENSNKNKENTFFYKMKMDSLLHS